MTKLLEEGRKGVVRDECTKSSHLSFYKPTSVLFPTIIMALSSDEPTRFGLISSERLHMQIADLLYRKEPFY